ncbi:MAG: hypothetical protein HQL99_13325 [Magnetococcales bacterium]|nr:hypothetical protein [Magnetococcales bacterium]
MGDYFALQPRIIQRLKQANIPGLGGVLPARDLRLLAEGRVEDAVVYVLFDGESVPAGEEYRAGPWQTVHQQWLVVLATKNYAAPALGDKDRAGPILWEINRVLQGWSPGPGMSALVKVTSPRASYTEKTTLYALRYAGTIQTEGGHTP